MQSPEEMRANLLGKKVINLDLEDSSANAAPASSLGPAQRVALKLLNQAIEKKDQETVLKQLARIETFIEKNPAEELQYAYNMCLSALQAEHQIEKFESGAEDYWSMFWSAVSYQKTGDSDTANAMLAEIEAEETMPVGNSLILSALLACMEEEYDEADAFLHQDETQDVSDSLQNVKFMLKSITGTKDVDTEAVKNDFFVCNFMTKAKARIERELAEAKQKAEEEARKKAELERKNKEALEVIHRYADPEDATFRNIFLDDAQAQIAVSELMTAYKQANDHEIKGRCAIFIGNLYGEEKYSFYNKQEEQKWYKEAIDHDCVDAYGALAFAYYNESNYKEAEKIARQGIERNDANSFVVLACVYAYNGDIPNAELTIQQGISKTAEPLHIYPIFADYIEADYPELSKKYALLAEEQCLSTKNQYDSFCTYITYTLCLNLVDENKKALDYYCQKLFDKKLIPYVEHFEYLAYLYFFVARLYSDLSNVDEAIKYFKLAIKNGADGYSEVAELYALKDDRKTAVSFYNKGIQYQKEHGDNNSIAEAILDLAKFYWNLYEEGDNENDKERAFKLREEANQYCPSVSIEDISCEVQDKQLIFTCRLSNYDEDYAAIENTVSFHCYGIGGSKFTDNVKYEDNLSAAKKEFKFAVDIIDKNCRIFSGELKGKGVLMAAITVTNETFPLCTEVSYWTVERKFHLFGANTYVVDRWVMD